MNDTDKLLTIQEASDEFFSGKLSGQAVLELWRSGELPGFRAGRGKGKVLLHRDGLEKYVAHKTVKKENM